MNITQIETKIINYVCSMGYLKEKTTVSEYLIILKQTTYKETINLFTYKDFKLIISTNEEEIRLFFNSKKYFSPVYNINSTNFKNCREVFEQINGEYITFCQQNKKSQIE